MKTGVLKDQGTSYANKTFFFFFFLVSLYVEDKTDYIYTTETL